MGEGADFARGAAGRGLTGQRERAVSRLRDFPGQQMDVVDHLVRPDAAHMLVEAHRPERHHLGLRVRHRVRPVPPGSLLHARQLRHLVQRVFRHQRLERFEVARRHLRRVGCAGGRHFERMLRPQPVADIGLAGMKVVWSRTKASLTRPVGDDVVGDVVEDRQVRSRLEYDGNVGKVHRAVREGRQHRAADMRVAEPAVGDAASTGSGASRPCRAPQHDRVGMLEIVIAPPSARPCRTCA